MSDLEQSDSEEEFDDDDNNEPSFVLIGIDTHSSMFLKNEEGGTHFQNCLNACHYISDCLVMSTDTKSYSHFAVILATEDGGALVKFNDNVIDSTKLLKQLTDLPLDHLTKTYMRNKDFDLASFFLTAKKQFNDVKSLEAKKTFLFLTTDDNPVDSNSNKRFTSLNEAQNFNLAKIKFEVVPLNDTFNYNIFYNELYIVCECPLIEQICTDLEGLLEKLSHYIIYSVRKRKIIFYPFHGHFNKFIKCYKMNYIIDAKILKNAMATKDGELVEKEFNMTEEVGSAEFELDDDLLISAEDKNDIFTNNMPKGLLLYLVSPKVSDPGICVSPPWLLALGDEENPKYFHSFWQYCVNKDRVLLCFHKHQLNSQTRIVEMTPKMVNKTKMFLVKTLPFENEQEDVEIDECEEEISVEDKTLMRELIGRLEFDYDPSFFQDIEYAKTKSYVKSKFLDQKIDEDEEIIECAVSEEAMEERLGDLFAVLGNTLDSQWVDTNEEPSGSNPKKSKV